MQRDTNLKRHISARLARFERAPLPVDTDAYRRAAVALVVVDEGSGADLKGLANPQAWSTAAALLLTRRPETMKRHAGQWALPGGRLDPGETVVDAALRETLEEVGLELRESAVLGRLDDFATRSGFIMSPVVCWGGAARELTPAPGEVASIHRIPLTEFDRDDAPLLGEPDAPELADAPNANPVLRMPVGDDWIAAPTAALLYQFREVCLRGLSTRVAHYEQPSFAWR
ncbi:MAG: CoA pyrophosphatase [Pseudomonadota bacterium]